MTLNCTLVGGPASLRGGPPLELSIDAAAGTVGSAIHEQLVRKFGAGTVTVGGKDLCGLVVGVSPLVEAAILVDGGPAPLRPRRQPGGGSGSHLVLTVDTGAAAGTSVPLRRGSYTIGRSGTSIAIPDPELSREHARLVVGETDIVLIDLESANGTFVNGERIRSAKVSTASRIKCGESNFSLTFSDLPGQVLAEAGRSVAEPIVVSGRIDAPNRAVFLVTAVLPLAIGVLLAVFTGMWMFLAFSAASAVSLVVPALGNRRQRRALSAAVRAAVEEDKTRRRRCGPPLSMVALAAHQRKETPAKSSEDGGVWLRLGEAEQAPNIRIEPAPNPSAIPPAGHLPVLLDPGRPLTTLSGSRAATDGVLRSLLMQLAGYPQAAGTRVVIQGQPGTLPLTARYLPGVTLTATIDAALCAVRSSRPPGWGHAVLLIRGEALAAEADCVIRDAALRHGWQVLHFLQDRGKDPSSDVHLSGGTPAVMLNGGATAFVPDLVPEEVFAAYCRRLAGGHPPDKEQVNSVPAACSLAEVLPLAAGPTAKRWEANELSDGLAVPLGLGASGPKLLDLQADGPHLLVAGTTGSGKSELLRSLTLALALSYPPERVNFFFIDFKGGSGLVPLSGLVHCVGVQTDLSAADIDRTLTSLRAEVRLREMRLSAARVPDISAYRLTAAAKEFVLPNLVIVIDEFRMLVDDAPEVLRELLRIAATGRSLGIHLVMATQRPQGALTADIRANVTSSIALRVQSDMESVDIIHTKEAAAIGVDAPGRAFLARGTEPAEEFQAASSTSTPGGGGHTPVTVHRTTDYLCRETDRRGGPASALTPVQAAEPLATMVRTLCSAQGRQSPRRPVAPPLPEELGEPACDGPSPAPAPGGSSRGEQEEPPAGQVRLGLMDLPARQQVEPLGWGPAHHGHAAFIGSAASGAEDALELTVHQVMNGAADAHFYFLDAPGSLLPLARAPGTGAHAGLHDIRRGVRILERLVRELGDRLASPTSSRLPLILAITGWGSWVSAFRSGPLAWAEDLVHDLVRDGARAQITLLISGERELVTARFFGTLPNRFYFPAGSTEESRALWPRMPAVPAVAGRAVAFGPVAGGGPAISQFHRRPAMKPYGRIRTGYPPASPPPFRVEPLPLKISAPQVVALSSAALPPPGSGSSHPGSEKTADRERSLSCQGATSGGQLDVTFGVAGDEPAPASFRMPGGGLFAVLGNPGSGRSNTLHALKALNPTKLWHACPSPSGPAGQAEAAGDFLKHLLIRAEAGALSREGVLLVDDVDLLSPPALRDLERLNALGCSLVVSAAYSPVLLQRVPLIMNARLAGVGLLLAPRSAADGDLFGIRVETEPAPPPGRGVLISGGRSCPVQVAWAGADG
ncbi:FtsK/SpoIIIE domain-containing protein [Pseudarthrobacter phenanthrenivorans]|uniref:FtsK/SpoIIIE domain-containing protein n=1 Tax=Pseudarthrobacter phenanthrenivorans TaxID=361575 RepID=UPI002F3594CB